MIDVQVRVIRSALPEADSLEARMLKAVQQEMHYLASAAARGAPVAGGQLRRSITGYGRPAGFDAIEGGLEMEPTWPFVEFGTGPHRNPLPPMPVYLTDEMSGTGSIERWIMQKGMSVDIDPFRGKKVRRTAEDAAERARRSLAFLIARKIRKYGTREQPFVRPAIAARAARIVGHVERVIRGGA